MRHVLVGSQVRERRQALGLAQSRLAGLAGISPSYLHLIETNRRNVGGALLKRLADALALPLEQLDGAAQRQLLDALGSAAGDPILEQAPAAASAVEFASRHEDWARVLVTLHRAYRQREAALSALCDRLNQDPVLAGAVHGMLTHVTALRSASEILEAGEGLDDAQRERFLAIVADESRRLSDVAQDLAGLFAGRGAPARPLWPADELDDFLSAHEHYFPRLEAFAERCGRADGADADEAVEQELAQARALRTAPARELARAALRAYLARAVRMPYEPFRAAARAARHDLDALAQAFGAGFDAVALRLASLRRPRAEGLRFGLVRCDRAGQLTHRIALPQLPLSRHGAGCPLWVLYDAFRAPGTTLRQLAEFPGGERFLLLARAIAAPPAGWREAPPVHALMLVCPLFDADQLVYADGLDLSPAAPATPVGRSCRACPREDCASRHAEAVLPAMA